MPIRNRLDSQRRKFSRMAFYETKLHEFILPYDTVRTAERPDEVLLDFAQSAYDAASKLGKWDRAALEEKKPALHLPRQHS